MEVDLDPKTESSALGHNKERKIFGRFVGLILSELCWRWCTKSLGSVELISDRSNASKS
ncbi:hypothetical protein ACS0TY_019350 [Phlomoides rotata]